MDMLPCPIATATTLVWPLLSLIFFRSGYGYRAHQPHPLEPNLTISDDALDPVTINKHV